MKCSIDNRGFKLNGFGCFKFQAIATMDF